jgi:hypothetical protein
MKHLDDTWISLLLQAAGIASSPYLVLGPTASELKDLFDTFTNSRYQDSPSLSPNKQRLAAARISDSRHSLQALRTRITDQETNRDVRDAYTARIDELLASLELIEAADQGDMHTFTELNMQVYGQPDAAIYQAAKCILQEGSDELAPDPATYKKVWRLHNGSDGFFEQLFDGVDIPAGSIDQYTGDELLRALLRNLQAESYTITDAPDPYWGLDHTNRLLIRPKWYNLSREEFLGVVSHEIGSHLMERLRGDKQPLRLLGLGLAGYERYNEGRALVREQVAYPNWEAFASSDRWHEILCRHVAIGLAVGLDGSPKNFAEVYADMYAINKKRALLQGKSEYEASRQTWALVTRCLNGTDGQGGACYKDIVYLEGNVHCWQLAREDPEIILQDDLGKYNRTDKQQVALLTRLGIL